VNKREMHFANCAALAAGSFHVNWSSL